MGLSLRMGRGWLTHSFSSYPFKGRRLVSIGIHSTPLPNKDGNGNPPFRQPSLLPWEEDRSISVPRWEQKWESLLFHFQDGDECSGGDRWGFPLSFSEHGDRRGSCCWSALSLGHRRVLHLFLRVMYRNNFFELWKQYHWFFKWLDNCLFMHCFQCLKKEWSPLKPNHNFSLQKKN